jgi:hypothetical protein
VQSNLRAIGRTVQVAGDFSWIKAIEHMILVRGARWQRFNNPASFDVMRLRADVAQTWNPDKMAKALIYLLPSVGTRIIFVPAPDIGRSKRTEG